MAGGGGFLGRSMWILWLSSSVSSRSSSSTYIWYEPVHRPALIPTMNDLLHFIICIQTDVGHNPIMAHDPPVEDHCTTTDNINNQKTNRARHMDRESFIWRPSCLI